MEIIQDELIRSIKSKRLSGKYWEVIHEVERLFKKDNLNEQNRFLLIYEEASCYKKLRRYTDAVLIISRWIGEIEDRAVDIVKLKIYKLLSSCNYYNKNYSVALGYLNKSFKIAEDNDFVSEKYVIYLYYFKLYRKLKEYDKSLEYLNKSKLLNKNDLLSEVQYNINKAVLYTKMGKKKRAYEILIEAKEIALENNFCDCLIEIYINLADTIDDYTIVEQYLNKGLILAREYEQYEYQIAIIKRMSLMYEQNNDYKNALLYYKLYVKIREMGFNKENEEKYNLIEKNIEIEIYKKDLDVKGEKNTELVTINKRLKDLLNIKNRLFSIIGHDLRGLIFTILSSFELINKLENMSENKKNQYYKNIEESVCRMQRLLNDLLIWGQVMNGDIIVNKEEVSLNKELLTVKDFLEHSLANKKINLIIDIPENTNITSDKYMLVTIIRNILSNAIKYSFPQKSIFINTTKKDNFFWINIKDEGVGIDEDSLKKLMLNQERFSTYGTENEKGNGFGLVICQEFIQRLEGKIEIESKKGYGTTFSIVIPWS